MKYNVKGDIVIIFPQLQSKIDKSINSTVFFFQSSISKYSLRFGKQTYYTWELYLI